MKDKKNGQISAAPAFCVRLGAQVEKDGILFAAVMAPEKQGELLLYQKGSQEIAMEVPFPSQPCAGVVRAMKVSGISPIEYEYNFRIDGKVVTDPAARLVTGTESFGDRIPKREHQVRAGFVFSEFDWGEKGHSPRLPWETVISYQLHVRGFTMQKNSRVKHRGTFLGVQEKIPYLKELGINQAILMPAYEFEEIRKENHTAAEKLNYWGYGPGCYYAPKASYSATGKPDIEFKSMVKAFHENGMEVVMQFCFPDPVDCCQVRDCLLWWMTEYRVDGFWLMTNQDAVNAVTADPFLVGTKLIAGCFPECPGYGKEGNGFPRYLAECNDGFQTDIRRLLKGDEDLLSSFVGRIRKNPKDRGVLNYVTNHDGFTLMDLVSYDRKHNEDNKENNRDGSDYNFSWNCGIEGPTRKTKIAQLRMRQMKNAFAMLLLAQGTPMLLAGDEFGNSQGGNNNPYCLDNEVSWVDWSREKANRELTAFVKELIAFRKAHAILHPAGPLTGTDSRALGYPDFSCHGKNAWYGGFEPVNRHIGLLYCGKEAQQDEFIYAAYNLHWEPQELALPLLPEGMEWKKELDTGSASGEENAGKKERQFTIPARTIQVLVGATIRNKKQKECSAQRCDAAKQVQNHE